MKTPTLYLVIGLPGSGKTTKAKVIEAQHGALRLSPDEWILNMYGYDWDRAHADTIRDRIESSLWVLTKKALRSGLSVVMDFGLWTKKERMKFRKDAERLGAKVTIIYCEASVDELWRRISKRPESKKGTLKIMRHELEQWAKDFEAPTKDELET